MRFVLELLLLRILFTISNKLLNQSRNTSNLTLLMIIYISTHCYLYSNIFITYIFLSPVCVESNTIEFPERFHLGCKSHLNSPLYLKGL